MSCPSPVPSERAPSSVVALEIQAVVDFARLHSFALWRLRARDDILFRSSFRRLVELSFWTLV
jgi:hypothetical protein